MRIAALLLLLTLAAQANPRVALVRSFAGQVTVGGEAVRRYQVLEQDTVLDLADGARVDVDFLTAGLRQSAAGPAHLTVGATGLTGAKVRSTVMARLSMMPDEPTAKGAGTVTRSLDDPDELTLRPARRTASPAFMVIPLVSGVQQPCDVAVMEDSVILWSSHVWPDQSVVECPLQLDPDKLYTISAIPNHEPQLDQANYQMLFSPLTEAEDERLRRLSVDLHTMARETQSATPLLFLMESLAAHYLFYDAAQVAEEIYKLGTLGSDRPTFLARARDVNLAARRFSRARFFEAELKR
ncbi:MAG: hypothetical protein AB7S38_37225 [Vulcanimicrobiota bacterium]